MTQKIVINTDFGGFGLSIKAFEMLLNLKGIDFESKPSKYGNDLLDYWHKGHVDENEFYLSQHDFYYTRSDAELVKVVEQLGDSACGNYSSLKVVEIPDGVEWYIHEYDGLEHVAEKHRTWQ
jgi:hypothetical protein